MKKNEALRTRRRHLLINLIGALLLAVAAVLVGLLFFLNSPRLQSWYSVYQDRLMDVEYYVLNLHDVWLILVVVLLFYAAKSVIPFFPITLMCLITGAVLPMYLSFAVNITGIMILVSIKYWWGRRRGGGQMQRLLTLNRDIRTYWENDRKSKPWLLFVFRVVPSFPVNPVSQLYGAMGFDFADYILISLLGFLPKLVSYTIIGKNVYDPLSVPFLIPMIIIFTLSGISIISINLTIAKRMRNEK